MDALNSNHFIRQKNRIFITECHKCEAFNSEIDDEEERYNPFTGKMEKYNPITGKMEEVKNLFGEPETVYTPWPW